MAVTSAPPRQAAVVAGELNVAFVAARSSFDELLAAIDVEGRAGDRGVGHEVDGQCGDVGRADDAADWQRGTELLAALAHHHMPGWRKTPPAATASYCAALVSGTSTKNEQGPALILLRNSPPSSAACKVWFATTRYLRMTVGGT